MFERRFTIIDNAHLDFLDEEVIRQSLPSVNPVSKKAKLARIDRRPRVIRHHAGAVADIDLPDEFYTPSSTRTNVLKSSPSLHFCRLYPTLRIQ